MILRAALLRRGGIRFARAEEIAGTGETEGIINEEGPFRGLCAEIPAGPPE